MKLTKTFSEYLVDEKLVSTENLVDLLIHQSKSLPSIVEIVREQQLLSPSQILAAIGYQMRSENSCDFVGACKDLGYWTPSVQAGVKRVQDSRKLPIAEALQKSGLVSTQKLVTALDAYLSEHATATPGDLSASRPADVPETTESVALEVVQMTAPHAEDESSHFADYYSQALHEKILTAAQSWTTSDEALTKDLIDSFHGLVGAARFAKLESLEALFKEAEASVRGANDLPAPLDEGLMSALRADLVSIVERVRATYLSGQEAAA